MLHLAFLLSFAAESVRPPDGGNDYPDSGAEPDSGIPCDGTEPRCEGATLRHCSEQEVVLFDCAALDPVRGSSCGLWQGSAECLLPVGANCGSVVLRSPRGGWSCEGVESGCVEGPSATQCVEGTGSCSPGQVGTCSGPRALLGCFGGQPSLLACDLYGGSCAGGGCIELPAGSSCGGRMMQCAAGLFCGPGGTCRPNADAGTLGDGHSIDMGPNLQDAQSPAPNDAGAIDADDRSPMDGSDAGTGNGHSKESCSCAATHQDRLASPCWFVLVVVALLSGRRALRSVVEALRHSLASNRLVPKRRGPTSKSSQTSSVFSVCLLCDLRGQNLRGATRVSGVSDPL